MKTLLILIPFMLLGCETEECKELDALEAQYTRAIAEAKARASLKKQTMERMTRFEAKAKETMAALGLDLPETKLKEILDERLAKIPGATIERTTKAVSEEDPSEGGAIHETMWRIEYPAKNDADGFAKMRALSAEPPLFQVITLLKQSNGKWLLELLRASVVEVPTNIQPVALEGPRSPSEVKSAFGLCGASDKRARLAELEKEWLERKTEAEELTVVMPKMATFEGLQRRAELAGLLERENRQLFEAFFTAVAKANVRYRAVGTEREIVIYELKGGAADRERLEKHLPEFVLKSMKELESATKDVIRLSVVNRVADQQIKHRRSSMVPGVGLAPEKHE